MPQLWKPSTCGCELLFEVPKDENGNFYDWDHPDVTVIQTKHCHRHENIEAGSVFYRIWLQENALIQEVLNRIKDVNPEFDNDPGLAVSIGVVEFDGLIVIVHTGLQQNLIADIQAWADASYGVGSVRVD